MIEYALDNKRAWNVPGSLSKWYLNPLDGFAKTTLILIKF
jgi:hypothetical protein